MPFTIIIPKISADIEDLDKQKQEEFVLEHILSGIQIKSLKNGESFVNLNHNTVHIKNLSHEKWTVNDVNVLKFTNHPSKRVSVIEIDGVLNERKNPFAKRNIQVHYR